MKRLFAIASFLCLCLVSLGAAALTLEPLPGSTPQTTCSMCLFPNPIGVIARDEAGAPVPNVRVTFSIPGMGNVIPLEMNSGVFKIMTGPDGVAAPRFLAGDKGKVTITASAAEAAPVEFDLKMKDKGPTAFEIVSGDGQVASTWTDFAQPWKVRAVDRHGRPVPYAAVMFAVAELQDYTAGLFGPRGYAIVAAGADGIATSPPLTANGTQGAGIGSAVGYGAESPFVQFHFEIVGPPASRDLVPVRMWVPSNDVGSEIMGYTVRVDELSGVPAANVPVVFATDPACAYWTGGFHTVSVMTDAEGLATSPTFNGISGTRHCAVTAKSAGAPSGIYDRHLFWPENVVMTATPASIETAPGRSFQITLTLTDDGVPIHATPFWVDVVRDGSAGADIGPPLYDPFNPGPMVYPLFANFGTGTYRVRFLRDPLIVEVPVVQRR